MNELWKPVPEWEHRYEVSDQGRVRSRDMVVGAGRGGATAVRKGRVLSALIKSGRYLVVTLAEGDRREQHFVHVLVARAFLGPRPAGHFVCHENDLRLDNRLANLRYDTQAGNEQDAMRNGRKAKGTAHGMARLTEDEALAILRSSGTHADVAARFGCSPSHVHSIRSRRVWKHLTLPSQQANGCLLQGETNVT